MVAHGSLMALLFSLAAAAPVTAAEAPVMPVALTCLVEAYPGTVTGAEHQEGTGWVVRFADNSQLAWDDGREKSFEERLEKPDLEDQMAIPYRLSAGAPPPSRNEDPGRIRNQEFFARLYGTTAREVEGRLTTVRWLPGSANRKVRVTTVNGVDRKLAAVSAELEALAEGPRRLAGASSGGYNRRLIKGTQRLSSHSWGIAIDIAVEQSDYWRWQRRGEGELQYRNRIPLEIVELFERHGFIWGGRWHHYDTMHFEYRPELLDPRCLAR